MKIAKRISGVGLLIVGLLGLVLIVGCDHDSIADAATSLPPSTATTPAEQTPPANSETPAQDFGNEVATVDQPVSSVQTEETDEVIEFGLVAIDELIRTPEAYVGNIVTVQGTIVTQCIRGCLFSLDDGTGILGVELVDNALERVLSGGSVGRPVEARGVIEGDVRPVLIVEEPQDWNYLD